MIDPIFADLAAFLPALIAEVRERQAAGRRRSRSAKCRSSSQAALRTSSPSPSATTPRTSASTRRRTRSRCRTAPAMCASPPATTSPTRASRSSPPCTRRGTRCTSSTCRGSFAFRPAAMARGMSMHESQSLSLEMLAGRSREFLGWLAPLMASAYGGDIRRAGRRQCAQRLAPARQRLHPGRGRRALLSAACDPALPAGAGADRRRPDSSPTCPAAWNELFNS
jgi:hypothetical protein